MVEGSHRCFSSGRGLLTTDRHVYSVLITNYRHFVSSVGRAMQALSVCLRQVALQATARPIAVTVSHFVAPVVNHVTPLHVAATYVRRRSRVSEPTFLTYCTGDQHPTQQSDQTSDLERTVNAVTGIMFQPFREVEMTLKEVDDLVERGDTNQSLARLNYDAKLEAAINDQIA